MSVRAGAESGLGSVEPSAPLVLAERASPRTIFEACYAAHRRRVFGWCLRYGGQRSWAEDVTHDVFMKLWERIGEGQSWDLDGEEPKKRTAPQSAAPRDIGGWLYRVTANLAFDRLRREGSIWGRVRARLASGASRPERAPTPEESLGASQSARAVLAAIWALPAQERVVLTMKLADGKSQREIATLLGLTEGYISKLNARALRRLRAAGWEDDHGDLG